MLKEYNPLPMPEGMSEGLLFSYAKGKQLDVFGKMVSVNRRKFEPDFMYKVRIRNKSIINVKEQSHVCKN